MKQTFRLKSWYVYLILMLTLVACGASVQPKAGSIPIVASSPTVSTRTMAGAPTIIPSVSARVRSIPSSRDDFTCVGQRVEAGVCEPTVLPFPTPTSNPARFLVTSYQNVLLTADPDPDRPTLPPAWLVVGNQAVQALYGSSGTYDILPSTEDYPVVRVPRGSRPVLVIGAGPITRISATGGSPLQRLGLEPDPVEPTSFVVEPIDTSHHYTLHVLVFFGWELGGDASYIWKIQPLDT